MAETDSHRRAKRAAAGKDGETEVALSGNRRLDALTVSGNRATEVERSGTPENLKKAALRLKASDAHQHILQVPQKDMDAAADAMRKAGVSGTIKNLGGTKRRSVRP